MRILDLLARSNIQDLLVGGSHKKEIRLEGTLVRERLRNTDVVMEKSITFGSIIFLTGNLGLSKVTHLFTLTDNLTLGIYPTDNLCSTKHSLLHLVNSSKE